MKTRVQIDRSTNRQIETTTHIIIIILNFYANICVRFVLNHKLSRPVSSPSESPALLSYTVYFIFNLHWDSSQVKSRFLCIVPVFDVHFFGHRRTSSYHRFVQRNVQVPDFMIDSLRFSFQIYILSESYNNSSPSALLRFSVPDGHKKKFPAASC